eukprot:4821548-Prorocentrum_lima.AAC.1
MDAAWNLSVPPARGNKRGGGGRVILSFIHSRRKKPRNRMSRKAERDRYYAHRVFSLDLWLMRPRLLHRVLRKSAFA